MPLPTSPWTIGTSVSVAKYMNAPETAANRLDAIGVAADETADPRRGNHAFVTRTAEQETGDQHAAEQQRHDLLGVIPRLVEPLACLALATGREPREAQDRDEERPRGVPRAWRTP